MVATTSSTAKADRLRELGAQHVINYRETPEWGVAAKQLTPGQLGFDIVVDVGGDATLGQALQATRIDGLVVAAGMVGGSATPVPLMSVLVSVCNVRGIILGTRQMMRDMIAFIKEHNIKPVLDDKVFSLPEAKDALQRMEEQKHFSKVIIEIKKA